MAYRYMKIEISEYEIQVLFRLTDTELI